MGFILTRLNIFFKNESLPGNEEVSNLLAVKTTINKIYIMFTWKGYEMNKKHL